MVVSLSEAASMLGKTPRQKIRYMVKKGELTARKIGGRWAIEVTDLPLTLRSHMCKGIWTIWPYLPIPAARCSRRGRLVQTGSGANGTSV